MFSLSNFRRCSLPLMSLLALLALLTLGTGCEEQVTTTSLMAPDNGGSQTQAMSATAEESAIHQALEVLWTSHEGVLMQVFKQTIDCQAGGVFTARPVGWPVGYDIVLTVDPGTVPLNHANLVEFVMEIPVSGPAGGVQAVPYEFHPDGIRFNQPVHITIAWPEWAGTAPASGMNLWYLEEEIYDDSVHYRVIDRKVSEPVSASPLSLKAAEAPLGHYSIDHFSRWVADNGDTGGGDNILDDGTASTVLLQSALTNVSDGDCCWIEVALNPDTQFEREF